MKKIAKDPERCAKLQKIKEHKGVKRAKREEGLNISVSLREILDNLGRMPWME